MNLYSMAQRQDENLVLGDSVQLDKRTIDGIPYRGFRLSTTDRPAITVKNIFQWYPFRERTEVTGWMAQAFNSKTTEGQLEVCLHNDAGDVLATNHIAIGPQPTPISLPEYFTDKNVVEDCHLSLRLEGTHLVWSSSFLRKTSTEEPNKAFIAIHKVLDRQRVINLCKGKGIEIGPGPKPQVMASKDVDVTYVEQSAPKDWARLYNKEGNYDVDAALWDRYQIGDACNLPAADDSLDFIFSSHVFEHLANPLGHLDYWASKLTTNGKVLGIVPDLAGCKDYVQVPSPMIELLSEQATGSMEPTLAHYARWAKHHRPGRDPAEFYEAKRSIHVHYYTNRNMTDVLQYAVDQLGYAWFEIRHTPNHKDFYFLLSK